MLVLNNNSERTITNAKCLILYQTVHGTLDITCLQSVVLANISQFWYMSMSEIKKNSRELCFQVVEFKVDHREPKTFLC